MSAKRPDPGMMARVNRLRSCALGRSAWQWVPGRAVMVDEVRWRAAVLRVRTMLECSGHTCKSPCPILGWHCTDHGCIQWTHTCARLDVLAAPPQASSKLPACLGHPSNDQHAIACCTDCATHGLRAMGHACHGPCICVLVLLGCGVHAPTITSSHHILH